MNAVIRSDLAKVGLATLCSDIPGLLNDHHIPLAVGFVLKIVIDISEQRLALDTTEAIGMEPPALRISIQNRNKKDKNAMRKQK